MKRNRRLLLRFGLLMAVLGGIAPVIHAATVTTTLPVAATVGAACSVSATGVNFGTLTGAAVNANGSITVTCANIGYAIGLDGGTHLFNFFGTLTRTMLGSDGDTRLSYRLYLNSALSQQWGDACIIGGTFSAGECVVNPSNIAQIHTVYASLQSTTTLPPAGTYSDTVLVTVQF